MPAGTTLRLMLASGAVFTIVWLLLLRKRLDMKWYTAVFDIFAIPMVFTLMCARVNCLFAGCCLGKIIGSTAMRWPTREAELVFYIIILVIMIPKVWKNKTNGTVYPMYMAAYGGFRLIEEFFREAATDSLFHISYL